MTNGLILTGVWSWPVCAALPTLPEHRRSYAASLLGRCARSAYSI